MTSLKILVNSVSLILVLADLCHLCQARRRYFDTNLSNSDTSLSNEIQSSNSNVPMGDVPPHCDNGKWRINIDWNGNPANYTCYSPKVPLAPKHSHSIEECIELNDYKPKHFCMTDRIHYNTTLPTFGDHRPLWPIYGEYRFLPPQRWLHNIEHGAVVMLYDPCTHPMLVTKLKKIVRNCIRKHVITPFNHLPRDRPLALITWGCKLLMGNVDQQEVVSFIKKTALHGPEGHYSKQGQYKFDLLRKARPLVGSDVNDSNLCPFAT